MKKILVLVHESLIPPLDKTRNEILNTNSNLITEYDVITTLISLKYNIEVLGVYNNLNLIKEKIDNFKPNIVFNLLEEFNGNPLYDQNVVSYLELLGIAYTGSNPRGLIIGRDKALSKKILQYHRIKTPKFFTIKKKQQKIKKPSQVSFPIIVKCLYEEASLGISKSSIVKSEEKLVERVKFMQSTYKTDLICEEFIEGRELYVGLYGNSRLHILPPRELIFKKTENINKEIYTNKAKWDEKYRKSKGIDTIDAMLNVEIKNLIKKISKKTYKVLDLSGYARIDFRLTNDNILYILEANPNPNIAQDDDFALSAKHDGICYKDLINKIVKLA